MTRLSHMYITVVPHLSLHIKRKHGFHARLHLPDDSTRSRRIGPSRGVRSCIMKEYSVYSCSTRSEGRIHRRGRCGLAGDPCRALQSTHTITFCRMKATPHSMTVSFDLDTQSNLTYLFTRNTIRKDSKSAA